MNSNVLRHTWIHNLLWLVFLFISLFPTLSSSVSLSLWFSLSLCIYFYAFARFILSLVTPDCGGVIRKDHLRARSATNTGKPRKLEKLMTFHKALPFHHTYRNKLRLLGSECKHCNYPDQSQQTFCPHNLWTFRQWVGCKKNFCCS